MELMLAHAGGLDEFLLILALVALPLVVLGVFARRARPDEEEEEDGVPME